MMAIQSKKKREEETGDSHTRQRQDLVIVILKKNLLPLNEWVAEKAVEEESLD